MINDSHEHIIPNNGKWHREILIVLGCWALVLTCPQVNAEVATNKALVVETKHIQE